MDINTISQIRKIHFIGVAGVGMSALAQYMNDLGCEVSGSDRYFTPNDPNETRVRLEEQGITCFLQDGSGVHEGLDMVITSTAIEDTVPEVVKAKALNIPIIRRSALLALIVKSRKTIAIAGTSGKSTTSGMLFEIMQQAGMDPGIISGAGLVRLIRQGKIGNAHVGIGEWLIIEADESDGSIVQYHPEIGVLLNIDKDHQEVSVLLELFGQFSRQCQTRFIVNKDQHLAAGFSKNDPADFSCNDAPVSLCARAFEQTGFRIQFTINETPFELNTIGRHNMENALAAVSVANQLGVSFETCSSALEGYEGIYRRHQLLGEIGGIYLVDDYAHNPVKCAASIAACQPVSRRVVAWFQPHGYGPTKFLKDDFIEAFCGVLRPDDEIWMSEIFYAGGTAVKDISAKDLTDRIAASGKKAFFEADRNQWVEKIMERLHPGDVLLLMGARDPSLEAFANQVKWALLQSKQSS